MRVDASEFPMVWLRDHDEAHEDSLEETRDTLIALMQAGQRFVFIAERLPRWEEMTEMAPHEKQMRAKLFKDYRHEMKHFCGGMILVGSASQLPQTIRKAIEGMTAAMGVAVLFAPDLATARLLGEAQLAQA